MGEPPDPLPCHAVLLTAAPERALPEFGEDCKAFEAAVTADYDAQSAVERELVLRLASLQWRMRRATTVETGPVRNSGRPSEPDQERAPRCS